MKPRSIGIVAGGGSPVGSTAILQGMLSECQKKFGCYRSYEYPCITFFSYPYSEIFLTHRITTSAPSRELGYCIQQLKNMGMEIIVIPCFTMSSFLTFRSYGVELIETGLVVQQYLSKQKITRPLVLCSERTRQSGYLDVFFDCQYPNASIQAELSLLLESALKGNKIDIFPLLEKLPDVPILSAITVLNAQISAHPLDARWINPNKLMAEYVIQRSFEESFESRASLANDYELKSKVTT